MALFLRGDYIVEYAFVLSKPPAQTDSAGHRQRLRERFGKDGLSGFHDYEVVEYLLTLSRVQGDCKAIAKNAIRRFGCVRGVMDAAPTELQDVDGIGEVSACTIKFARALAEYYYCERALPENVPLSSSRAVVDYLKVKMGSRGRESFWTLYLDAQNRPKSQETLFEGTITSSVVYPREVFKRALELDAPNVIVAHNHPSGCVEPSEQDRQITRDLVLAASYMDVRILDHIIVGAHEHFSFADHGLMQEYRRQAMDFQESRRRLP
ncbi:MAG: DNA repair protein RadC [Dehalococcoidia bacterium]|nr:DNA repair protein RadC [Dehalococcoidia bacterium]